MPTTLINLGAIGTTGVIFSAKADDAATFAVTVTAIVGSAITVEDSADNSSWAAMAFGQNVTAGPPGLSVTTGGISTNGRYTFRILTSRPYVRVRVSTYVGPGNVEAQAEFSPESMNEATRFIDTGAVAQGSTITNAVPIQAVYTRMATVAASTGVILPEAGDFGMEYVIRNNGANALNVYPPVGRSINGGAASAALSLAASGTFRFVSDDNGNYWAF